MSFEENTEHFSLGSAVTVEEPYEYAECGLSGIFLHNGFERTVVGNEEFVSIVDTEGLHRAIGYAVVENRKELSPDEFRFLRKQMGMTQSSLGRLMGQSSQQIARWEKGESRISGPAVGLIRVFFTLRNAGPEKRENLMNLLEEIEGMDELSPRRIRLQFHQDHCEWEEQLGLGSDVKYAM